MAKLGALFRIIRSCCASYRCSVLGACYSAASWLALHAFRKESGFKEGLNLRRLQNSTVVLEITEHSSRSAAVIDT